jgi:hypothetical protein
MIDDLILWIGRDFTGNLFDISTRIQEILWSMAELVIVFHCLRIADAVRTRFGKRPFRVRYMVFWCIVIANPIILFTAPGETHDKLMLLNFSMMVYTLMSERKVLLLARREILNV